MAERLNCWKAAPQGISALQDLQAHIDQCDLEGALPNLLKLRASQINGCAYCLDMHSKDARAAGESEQRIYTLSAWRETLFFSDREQAALARAEAVARIATGQIEDTPYEGVRRHFSEKEIVNLTLAVIAINGGIALQSPFGRRPAAIVS